MIRRAWTHLAHPSGIHPWRWRFLTLWVVGFSLLVGFFVQQGWQAHQDLCATRDNALTQARLSQQYLYDVHHDKRDPIKGITDNDILTGIKRQKAYAASIHC